MGQIFWITSVATAVAVVLGFSVAGPEQTGGDVEQGEIFAHAEPAIAEPETLTLDTSGSALATAAFGMSALQPETYNGELVQEIIEASPLADTQKQELFAALHAAEQGNANLNLTLAGIRTALAVE